ATLAATGIGIGLLSACTSAPQAPTTTAAPSAPQTTPPAAAKTAPEPASTSAPPAAPTAAVVAPTAPLASGAVTPKVNRVVFAVGAPGVESPRVTDISAPDTWVIGPAYEYLLGVSLDGAINVPQLAESWNVEPDAKSIRFKLRKGVPFHGNKGEFTAKDVVYSWDLMTAPDSKENRGERFRTSLERIEVVNDYE